MPHQVAVFLENKPGKLEKVTGLLAERKINIRAITIADSGGFGVLKLLVDDPESARTALADAGLAAVLKTVVAVAIPDLPGSLHRVLELLARHGVNIQDASGFVVSRGQEAVIILQVDEPGRVSTLLEKEGLALVSDQDLYFL